VDWVVGTLRLDWRVVEWVLGMLGRDWRVVDWVLGMLRLDWRALDWMVGGPVCLCGRLVRSIAGGGCGSVVESSPTRRESAPVCLCARLVGSSGGCRWLRMLCGFVRCYAGHNFYAVSVLLSRGFNVSG
jgi:hypothetical protein